MDTRPIGVFDSGIGGITTVKRLTEALPNEDIIYFGDTLRAPYGSLPVETIVEYACQDANFLATHDVKAMIIACNTICFSAYETIRRTYEIPVYEVIGAAASAAVETVQGGKIGVIATAATIQSGAYEAAINNLSPGVSVISKACPRFAPLVEAGRCSPDDGEVLAVAEEYLSGLRESGVDTLILGCTHYPLLSGVISKVMGPGVALISSGAEVVSRVAEDLRKNDMLTPNDKKGTLKCYVTGDADIFSATASAFLGFDIRTAVEQVTL